MRRSALALLLLVAVAFAGKAGAVEWNGDLIITNVAGCDGNVERGEYFFARFTPAGIGDNGSDTYLTLFQRSGALSFLLSEGSVTSSYQDLETMTIFQTHFEFPGTVSLRFTSVVPAITPTTNNLQITGQFRGFAFDIDCVATFRFASVRVLQ